jgi:hypothetical protein
MGKAKKTYLSLEDKCSKEKLSKNSVPQVITYKSYEAVPRRLFIPALQ